MLPVGGEHEVVLSESKGGPDLDRLLAFQHRIRPDPALPLEGEHAAVEGAGEDHVPVQVLVEAGVEPRIFSDELAGRVDHLDQGVFGSVDDLAGISAHGFESAITGAGLCRAQRNPGELSSHPMPTYRPDLAQIAPYAPGLPVEEVARRHGLDPARIIKLASNESPFGPYPEALEAMRAIAAESNRYPDNEGYELRNRLAASLGVASASIWLGGGSSELLRTMALAVGGPGTNAVYAWPSFVVYRLGAMWAMSERREVPLDTEHRHDLSAMAEAIDEETTLVFVCNPNNPTGTHLATDDVVAFVESVPERVTVVIDEAYQEFVAAADYRTMASLAAERTNLVVTRTFSKVYSLAALRVGYAIAHPATIAEMRRAQAPFTVTQPGQAAAAASLGDPGRLAARVEDNARGRRLLLDALEDREISHADSQANFVWFHSRAEDPFLAYVGEGIIVRTFGDRWVRVTVGTAEENTRFLEALDRVES